MSFLNLNGSGVPFVRAPKRVVDQHDQQTVSLPRIGIEMKEVA